MIPGKGEGRGREGRKEKRESEEGEEGERGGEKKVRTPLRQFLPTPIIFTYM